MYSFQWAALLKEQDISYVLHYMYY